jgi:hypothetical protein
MELQQVIDRESETDVYSVTKTVSGSDGYCILRGVTAGPQMRVKGYRWTSNASNELSFGVMTYTGLAQHYDPALVASILQADTAPPEASFNNVVDMLDWLNRV